MPFSGVGPLLEKFNGKLQFWGGISRPRVNFGGGQTPIQEEGVRPSLTLETQGRIP